LAGLTADAKEGFAIVGAMVGADGVSDLTDDTGYYNITVPAPGTYNLTASMSGYYDGVEDDVSVSKNATTTVDFTLQLIVGWINGTRVLLFLPTAFQTSLTLLALTALKFLQEPTMLLLQ